MQGPSWGHLLNKSATKIRFSLLLPYMAQHRQSGEDPQEGRNGGHQEGGPLVWRSTLFLTAVMSAAPMTSRMPMLLAFDRTAWARSPRSAVSMPARLQLLLMRFSRCVYT